MSYFQDYCCFASTITAASQPPCENRLHTNHPSTSQSPIIAQGEAFTNPGAKPSLVARMSLANSCEPVSGLRMELISCLRLWHALVSILRVSTGDSVLRLFIVVAHNLHFRLLRFSIAFDLLFVRSYMHTTHFISGTSQTL